MHLERGHGVWMSADRDTDTDHNDIREHANNTSAHTDGDVEVMTKIFIFNQRTISNASVIIVG